MIVNNMGLNMNQDELIEKLIEELAESQILLAKMIAGGTSYTGNLRQAAVARKWIGKAQDFLPDEWATGSRALSLFFNITDPSQARKSTDLMLPTDEKYLVGRKKMHHLYNLKSTETGKAIILLRQKYLPSPAVGQNQFPRCKNGGISGYRLFVEAWKFKLTEVPRWFRNQG